jgi:hypothetical protein
MTKQLQRSRLAVNAVTPNWFSDFLLAALMVAAILGLLFRHHKPKKHKMS